MQPQSGQVPVFHRTVKRRCTNKSLAYIRGPQRVCNPLLSHPVDRGNGVGRTLVWPLSCRASKLTSSLPFPPHPLIGRGIAGIGPSNTTLRSDATRKAGGHLKIAGRIVHKGILGVNIVSWAALALRVGSLSAIPLPTANRSKTGANSDGRGPRTNLKGGRGVGRRLGKGIAGSPSFIRPSRVIKRISMLVDQEKRGIQSPWLNRAMGVRLNTAR